MNVGKQEQRKMERTVNSKVSKIIEQVEATFGGRIHEQVEQVVTDMMVRKTLGNRQMDEVQAKFAGLSDGLFLAIKKAISEQRSLDNTTGRVQSSEEARINRILRVRDSNGRAKARKF
jgi:phosphoenolpyruvate carboxylase